MADQTNAEVSDERLRELLPCPFCGARLEQIVGTKGIYSCPTEGCYTRDIGVDTQSSDDVAAWNRRSVTSQASEGAVVAWIDPAQLAEHARADAALTNVSLLTKEFAEAICPTAVPLYVAPVSKRVERLETALRPFADCVFNDNGDMTISGTAKPKDFIRAYFAIHRPLQGGRS